MGLRETVAVVTGGGRGLGREVVLELVRGGARAAVISTREAELRDLAAAVEEIGGECLTRAGDVAREEDVTALFRSAEERFGAVHALVNNAAVIGPARFREDADPDAWRRAVDVNLNGPYLCCRAALETFARGGGGSIVNLSSGLGQMPFPRFCAYAVTKAGIIQLTRSLAEEFQPHGVRVNAVDPGVMDTSMQSRIRGLGAGVLGEEVDRQFRALKEEGRLKDPARVARLIAYLVSPASGRLTGRNGTLDDYREWGWPG